MTDRAIRRLTRFAAGGALLLAAAAGISASPTISQGEYFWDDDPGIGRGTPIPALAGFNPAAGAAASFAIPADGLAEGAHLLGIRVKTADAWSVTKVSTIVVPKIYDHSLTAAEYFWDADPGVGNATPVTSVAGSEPGAGAMFPVTLPAAELAEGAHLLGFRVKTADGWSVTKTSTVLIPKIYDHSLTAAEYFWDVDPGIGNATPVTSVAGSEPGAGAMFPLTVPAAELAEGTHLLGFRVKTADGWSVTKTDRVLVRDHEVKLIAAVEYFWGNDPGEGAGVAVPVTPAPEIELNPLTIPFPEEDLEEYTLSFRGMVDGRWGAVTSWTRRNVPVAAITLNKGEMELEAGHGETLVATVLPDNALFQDIDWTSSAPEIAIVGADGTVEGIVKGSADITARSRRYPDIEAVCRVTVTGQHSAISATPATDLTITAGEGGITITGDGEARGEVATVSGIVVARFDAPLPLRLPLAPAPYILTVNGSRHKLLVK